MRFNEIITNFNMDIIFKNINRKMLYYCTFLDFTSIDKFALEISYYGKFRLIFFIVYIPPIFFYTASINFTAIH